jgi:YesN/AraC family two-component response regulator
MVISDVMMPKMNGVELCKEIKDSLDTCHIPVILLTAKSEVDDRIEGLYAGADAYISKPFVIKELKLNIKNIIDSKNHLRNHFKTSGSIDIENTLTNKDEELIKRINSIVLKNMEDPDFDIDQLTKQAGVSRTVLHVKIKKIMGLSTPEFINTIRLNKAKELFSTTDLSIAEVAYMIGYREPNYFSRIFKKFFKISPSNFKKKIQEESTEVN